MLEVLVILGAMLAVAIGLGWLVVRIIRASADYLADDQITLTQHGTRWNYRFYEPVEGTTISLGGFRTGYGAWRSAQRKREDVARRLGNMCGLC